MADSGYRAQEVAPGVFGFMSPDPRSNGGFIVGDDGVVVIDGLFTPKLARDLMAAVKRATKKSVRWLVNTHYHGDHVFGNQDIAPAGVAIIAHHNTRSRLIEMGPGYVQQMAQMRPEMADDFKEVNITLPQITVAHRLTLHLGNRVADLIYVGAPAHTHGDILVYLRQEKVLFAGDILFANLHPVVDLAVGSVAGFLQALRFIDAMDIGTIVPGHGPVSTKKEIGEEREFFFALRQLARAKFDQGMSVDQAVKEVKMDAYAHWPLPERIENTVRVAYQEFQKGL